MKKFLALLVMATVAFGMISCGTTTEGTAAATTAGATTVATDGDIPDKLEIQFVPSTDFDIQNITKLNDLEDMLEAELSAQGYDISVQIGVATSYQAVITAMTSDQVQVGFLTAQQYAYTTLTFPDTVNVLLTSVRNAYNIQIDGDGNEITDKAALVAAANATGYDASTTSDHSVSSYYSMLLVRSEDYADYQTNGIAALAGKTIGVQDEHSGSGYVYPSFLLSQNNLSFVTGTPGANEVKAQTIDGHTNAVLALLNDEVDGVFTFFDARYITSAYTSWQDLHPSDSIFDVTKVVALTDPIYNDTISCVASLDSGLQAAIQTAFMNIIQTEEGLDILSIYNHTGYMIAQDSDYDSERALYQFLNPSD